jgi:sulfide:quinone oxidoreductase
MASIVVLCGVVLGAGIGGMNAACELRAGLDLTHTVMVVGEDERFSFTPSNPWVAVTLSKLG